MQNLPPEDKLKDRFDAWLAAEGVKFVDIQAEQAYRRRVQRFVDVIRLKKPDRVPVVLRMGAFPARYSGIDLQTAMYDRDAVSMAIEKYVLDFAPDAGPGGFGLGPGKALEIIDYRLYRWPGHGVSADTPFQYVESENMKEDEYDELIHDPSSFMTRKYLVRVCGKLGPFGKLPPAFGSSEMMTLMHSLIAYGDPEVQEAYQFLFQAGIEAARWARAGNELNNKMKASGFPNFEGGVTIAPFDIIGDTLRGTLGIMKDMYRRPGEILRAVEQITPLMIDMAVSRARMGNSPVVFIPLHKGADGFMSDTQFKKFYWPTLRAVILGLVDQGLIPYLFAEGGYNSRLEAIRDIPPGKTVWLFDRTDMEKAKTVLGDVACIMGNVPGSLIMTGSSDEVANYCKNLIDVAGKGGGFILAPGAVMDSAKPENLKAIIETARTYGVY